MASTSLPVISKETYAKFNACIHCGLCLPACPTYVETADEADSPRGRIHLMKAIVDGHAGPSDVAFEHLDRCLVCRACEPACPSGVDYHSLIEAVRPQVAAALLGKGHHMKSGMLQWIIAHILPYPKRLAAAMLPLKLAQKIGLGALVEKCAPGAGQLAQAASRQPGQSKQDLPNFTPAVGGGRRGSVILLRGCVGSVLSPAINAACARVLSRNGYDVLLLPSEPCCGALAAHANDPQSAHTHAAGLVDALASTQADFIISPIAGCGAQLKSLDKVLADTPAYAQKAQTIARRIRDISEFLIQVGITPPTTPLHRTVTYHDPCHLAHAQRITDAPRQLLSLIPGLKIIPLPESDMCCGAAGTYSMNQPDLASRLGQRKAKHILTTHADELITANIGCALQIARHLSDAGRNIPVKHVIELLDEAYARA